MFGAERVFDTQLRGESCAAAEAAVPAARLHSLPRLTAVRSHDAPSVTGRLRYAARGCVTRCVLHGEESGASGVAPLTSLVAQNYGFHVWNFWCGENDSAPKERNRANLFCSCRQKNRAD